MVLRGGGNPRRIARIPIRDFHHSLLAARAVPRLLALRDVLPDPVQTRANTSASAL